MAALFAPPIDGPRRLRRFAMLLAALLLPAPALADKTIGEDLFLRLDPGHHTRPIVGLAADPRGQTLLTVSQDQSVRLWDLRSGDLLRTLWLPPETDLKEIRYVSLSADGQQAVATNASGPTYIFDWQHGTRHKPETPYAAPGRSAPGWALFSPAVNPEGRFHFFGDGVPEGIDRDEQGRVVKAANQRICLYTPELHHLAELPLSKGTQPGPVRFSPRGDLVAVGYPGSPLVEVRSGADLHLLYKADTGDLKEGDLRNVAFSADGKLLYAGGSARGPGGVILRRFADAGRGKPTDLVVGPQEITDLAALPGGRMAYSTMEPAWGVVAPPTDAAQADTPVLTRRGPPTQVREGRLYVNQTGDRVWFPVGNGTAGADSGVEFSLGVTAGPEGAGGAGHGLRPSPRPDPALRPPAMTHPELAVLGWYGGRGAVVNGRHLNTLPKDNLLRSLAISPDGQVLLGSDLAIYRVASDKVLKLEEATEKFFDEVADPVIPVPGRALAVNFSGDGRVIVAALHDGTIRWYRAADGQPMLALYPHEDGRRWVLFLPSSRAGFYDVSVGGEDLMGWQVERGGDLMADFVPAAVLRQDFYRPDVVARVLAAGDPWRAVAQANHERAQAAGEGRSGPKGVPDGALHGGGKQALPPTVRIVDTREDAAGVVVRVAVRSPGGEVTGLRALVNGRPAAALREVLRETAVGEEVVRELKVPIGAEAGEVLLSVLGQSARGSGAAATLRLHRGGESDGGGVDLRPNLYVLAVGIGAYRQSDLRLRYPAKDATDLAAAWRGQKGRLYRDVQVRLLTDEHADRRDVLEGLQWLRKQTTDRDMAVLFFAGHGVEDPATGQYYFVPHDGDLGEMMATMIPDVVLREALAVLPGKVLMFLDTCHAGRVFADRALRGAQRLGWTRWVNELSSADSGVVVFAATTGRQAALEDRRWGNGAFTRALLEGLRGQADQGHTGRVTVNMLDLYVSERVKVLTDGTQTPTTAKPSTVPDYPLSVRAAR